jgi:hypothetical protein
MQLSLASRGAGRLAVRIGFFVVAALGPLAAVAETATTAPGGDATLACGQSPNGRAYWTEYGFCDMALKGAARAKGLVLWMHGVSGDRVQYKSPPPAVVRRLAEAGWDVIRINRNNLYERGWTSSGVRHRDDAIERLRQAKAQGYRAIILAGQSYGGAIALEPNAKAGEVDGVLAFSPGHGSDLGQPGGGVGGVYFNLDRYLLDAVATQKGGRVVVLVAYNDRLHPNRSAPGSQMGPRLRQALAGTGRPYVVFDESGPIWGHGAGSTNQFSRWYGACVVRFLDPAQAVNAGETVCPPPNPVPAFLLPDNLRRPAPGTTGAQRWLGVWQGSFGEARRDLLVVVESIEGATANVVYAPGAGPQHDLSMGYDRYAQARVAGERIVIDRGQDRTLELRLSPDGQHLEVVHKSPQQTATGVLARAN